MGKKKKKKGLADETCRLCRRRVGKDPFGFARFEDGSVACLHHPGILAHAVASRQVVFAKNTGDPRSGKYVSVDSTKAEEDAVKRTLDSLKELTEAAATSPKKKAGRSLDSTVSCNEPNTQLDDEKRGKGGRGDGGVREGVNEVRMGRGNRRPIDPRENLFRLDRPESKRKQNERSG